MSEARKAKVVICENHGRSRVAYLCQHLVKGSNLGFCVPGDFDPDQDDPEAWCNGCDIDLESEGWVWNDVSERNLGLTALCSGCFEPSRERNQASTRGKATP